MNIHEQKKTCKIIDEFVLYLMRKGQKKVNVDINLDNENETIIKVKTTNLQPEVIESARLAHGHIVPDAGNAVKLFAGCARAF